jgi:uncharacterized protein (TIGR01777 family)
MKWLLAGASGFLGSALRTRLADEGHQVVRLVRREPATATEFRWDPAAGRIDGNALEGVDVVVNLAGVNLFTWVWTTARREQILASRVDSTATLATVLARRAVQQGHRPVFVSQSSVGYYGGFVHQDPRTEDSPAAPDFAAQVCVRWEAATRPAADAGVPVVTVRSAPVMDRSGSAFLLAYLAWSAGLGAVLGDGRQRMCVVSLDDYLRAVLWLANRPGATGPYNVTIPTPTTNAEFSDTLARALHRPRVLKVPAFLLKTALDELSGQMLGDMWVVPQRLLDQGFRFTAPDVASTINEGLHRS